MSEKQPVDSVKIKSLYKAVQLLSYFDVEHSERGVSELAELSGMLKSSTHNILSTFEACGILKRASRGGKYLLGPKVLELARCYSAHNTIESMLKPYMDALANRIGERVYLAIPEQDRVVYIQAAYPAGAMELAAQSIRGASAPMYCTGVGKAMLAYLPESAIPEPEDGAFARFTPNTLTTAQALRADLELVRERGYALDNMEHEYGVRCVGAALRDKRGAVVGGLSISGPSLRIAPERDAEYGAYLVEIAEALKKDL